jgi:hypothetical protein
LFLNNYFFNQREIFYRKSGSPEPRSQQFCWLRSSAKGSDVAKQASGHRAEGIT